MIELDNITIALPAGRPGATDILHDVSFRIDKGDWIAITGPNGAGKTTLLKTIAGLIEPRRGRVDAAGTPVIGLLVQEPDNQFVASTVGDELILSVPPSAGRAERARRTGEAIERFALGPCLERNPHRLSGGEKQRLAFATVWLGEPDIVLLDEPASYLDRDERRRLLGFVRDLNDRGVAVVWTTHSAGDIEQATTVITIDEGHIEYMGASGGYDPCDDVAVAAAVTIPAAREDGEAVVALESVTFAYDGAPILAGVDFVARAGLSMGVAGRNGSGKSTLLALVSGILAPRSGRVRRAYQGITHGGKQNVFHLFQNPERLFFAETVFEEVAFGLKALGRPGTVIARTVDEALDRVGLEPDVFAGRLPFSLSTGEMRRLAFAIAFALEPKLLVLDEAASSLDAAGRRVLSGLIARSVSGGACVVLATHDTQALAGVTHDILEL